MNLAVKHAMDGVRQAVAQAESDLARPMYHFRPPARWMNDPNGPVYYGGYYHLFYQFNPYNDVWGNMHWGHTRSKDLVHWEHLPVALWPSKELGENHCFSGSTALLPGGSPMIFYTSIGDRLPEQWAATPVDNALLSWEKHPANPILTEALHPQKVFDWRDPYVFQAGGRTWMVCGGNLDNERGGQAAVNLYKAQDETLTDWSYAGILFQHPDADIRNIECPNFLRLGEKWVLLVSPHQAVQYFIGDFDPGTHAFTWTVRGILDTDQYYAPNGLSDPSGRHILWGWVRGFPPDKGWNGCLTLPRILSLDRHGQLIQTPAPELEALRESHTRTDSVVVDNTAHPLPDARGDLLEIAATVDLGKATSAGLQVLRSEDGGRSVTIRYTGSSVDVAGTNIPLPEGTRGDPVKLHVFLDKSVLEVYINDGVRCATRVIPFTPGDEGITVFADGGASRVTLDVWSLQPIW